MSKYTITIDKEGKPQDKIVINTEGYVLLHLQGMTMKSVGNIEMSALAPILLKLAAERIK